MARRVTRRVLLWVLAVVAVLFAGRATTLVLGPSPASFVAPIVVEEELPDEIDSGPTEMDPQSVNEGVDPTRPPGGGARPAPPPEPLPAGQDSTSALPSSQPADDEEEEEGDSDDDASGGDTDDDDDDDDEGDDDDDEGDDDD